MIKSSDPPEKQNEKSALKLQEFEMLLKECEQWDEYKHKNDVVIHKSETIEGHPIGMFHYTLNCTIDEFIDNVYFKQENNKILDPNIKYEEELEDQDEKYGYIIAYAVYDFGMLSTDRDFCIFTVFHQEKNDLQSSSIAEFSCQHDKKPQNKKYIRANLLLSGTHLEQINQNQISVTQIISLQLGGSLGSMGDKEATLEENLEFIKKLRKILNKQK